METRPPPASTKVFTQALPGIQAGDLSDLMNRCTVDVVFEFPFAPNDRPRRVEGRDAVRAYLEPMFARSTVRDISSLVLHQTVDPAVGVIEFTTTVSAEGGQVRDLSYIVVLTVRDGQIARYRDYWNPLAFASQS